jgi:Ca2+-binding RTX toxin-like protein
VPDITTFAWGGFLIAWQEYSRGTTVGDPGVRGQLFDADGTKIGSEFNLDSLSGSAGPPTIAALSNDTFVATWGGATGAAASTGAIAQRFFALPQLGTTGADVLTGASKDDAIAGRAGDDTIAGKDGNDALEGGAGSDRLEGGTGDDALDGGSGDDTLIGGPGNDRYYVDSAKDVVTEDSAAGLDTVFAAAGYTISANIEALTLVGSALQGTGNAGDNTLTGNDLDNVLDGGGGADTMAAGRGNDTYIVDNAGDIVTETSEQGIDLIVSSITVTLPGDVENLTLSGSAAIDGTGNWSNNRITGNTGNNLLRGDYGNDTLAGLAGDDLIDGGNGTDVAVFAGARASYTVTIGDNAEISVSSTAEGNDQLRGIEVLRFADGAYVVDAATSKLVSLDGPANNFRLFAPTGFTGHVVGAGTIFGTNGPQEFFVESLPSALRFDPSFNRGGDVVRFETFADDWQIARTGSSAQLTNGYSTVVIPVGTTGTYLQFFDGVRLLRFDQDAGVIKIAGQTVTTQAQTITALAEPASTFLPLDDQAAGRLFLSEGSSVTLQGTYQVFGTAGSEHVTLIEGKMTLDPSFNRGGDLLSLVGYAQDFSAVRVGSSVKLTSPGSEVVVPVGVQATMLDFEDGDRELRFDPAANGLFIGDQLITTTPVTLTAFA